MRKIILSITIFLSVSSLSITSAQNNLCDSNKRISLSFCPTEMPFGYETLYLDYKFSKRFSLGIAVGHTFPNVIVNSVIAKDKPEWASYNGTVVRFNAKYFVPRTEIYFLANGSF